MNQAVLRTKIADDLSRPQPARLPGEAEWLRPDLLKEAGKILDVGTARLERRRALEEYDTGSNDLGNLKCLNPCLPDFVGILKRPEERASFGIDWPPQSAVGGTRRRVRDQLPCLETKLKLRRCH